MMNHVRRKAERQNPSDDREILEPLYGQPFDYCPASFFANSWRSIVEPLEQKDDDDNRTRCSDFIERRHVIERHVEIEVQSQSNFNTRETLLASAPIPYLFALGIPSRPHCLGFSPAAGAFLPFEASKNRAHDWRLTNGRKLSQMRIDSQQSQFEIG
jgi:hypothetical protein